LFDIPWTPIFLGILFFIDPLLGVVATGGGLLLLGLAILNDRATRPHLTRASGSAVQTYAFADDLVRHADVVRAMSMQQPLIAKWRLGRNGTLALQGRASDITAGLTASTRFCRMFLQAMILAVGATLVLDHRIVPATIFAASVIMARALAPIEQAITAWRQFGAAGEAALRMRRLLHQQPAPPVRTRLGEPSGALRFDNVVYAPPGAGRPIVKSISFDIAGGQSLGVVGPSGAGKTTLLRLMVGAVAPTAGQIRLDGADLSLWHRDDVGRHIGYLPDYVGLFAGSVRENIARFSDADDDEVIAAARIAGVHEMILTLPEGYDTRLSENAGELSGGQRQRIGLARALFGPPRLVVLDEPNAHLDVEGERALERALGELKARGTTVVIVTHRPSALGLADRIVVVRDGRVEMAGARADIIEQLRQQTVRPVAATGNS
ncbi:MAG: type I secretion system permease/ATPase, partial [Xanthobacteraceae bacterium]